MNKSHLSQDAIDHGAAEDKGVSRGLLATATNHPFLTGGAIVVGAGLAFAAGRMIKNANGEEVAESDSEFSAGSARNVP